MVKATSQKTIGLKGVKNKQENVNFNNAGHKTSRKVKAEKSPGSS